MPFEMLVKRDAKIPDTLNLINKAVNVYEHSPFVDQLTKALNPAGDKKAFIKRLFDYVCRNVDYQLDTPGDEEVWSPQLTVKRGVGDCKKMTTLIACVLKNAGIEPVLKHVYYDNELHTHIYVIVPFPDLNNYLTVDPVNHKQWNKEVKYKSASLHFLNGHSMNLHMMGQVPEKTHQHRPHRGFQANWNMPSMHYSVKGIDNDLAELAGIGCPMGASDKEAVLAQALMGDYAITGLDDDEIMNGISGIGRKSKAQRNANKSKRHDRRQKLFHVFKAVNLAPSRASFLLLVRSNIFRLANRMAKVWIHNPDSLVKVWKQFGGNPDKLKATIKAGAWPSIRSQIKGISGISRMPSVNELEAMETNGIGFPPAIAAAIAAATPIVLAMIKIIGQSKHDQDTDEPSNAEILAESAAEGANNYASSQSESTEGIGYMDSADEIVTGPGEYDYVDGMGKRRKKDKTARKAKKEASKKKKRAEKEAKKAAKKSKHAKGGGDNEAEGESYLDVAEETVDKAKKDAKITDDDVKTFSKLAEYGANKILKGQVTHHQINQMEHDEGGTTDTPQLPAEATHDPDDISVPKGQAKPYDPANPSAGSFGLTEINSLATFLHWLKGAIVLALAAGALTAIVSDVFIIGSFLWFTRIYIFSFTKNVKTWLTTGKR